MGKSSGSSSATEGEVTSYRVGAIRYACKSRQPELFLTTNIQVNSSFLRGHRSKDPQTSLHPICSQLTVHDDKVKLVVPAAAAFVPTIRLAASSLAGRDRFDYDRIEDLRIAVSEAAVVLLGRPLNDPHDTGSFAIVAAFDPNQPHPTLEVTLARADGAIECTMTLHSETVPSKPSDLSRQIFDALTDDYDLRLDDPGGPTVWFLKRRADANADD